MLANIPTMSPDWTAVFYGVAVLLALVACAKTFALESKNKIDFFALSFAVFVFVFF